MIPDDYVTERPVDLALLCGGNWDRSNEAEAVVRLSKAKHWEDFFVPQSARPSHPDAKR